MVPNDILSGVDPDANFFNHVPISSTSQQCTITSFNQELSSQFNNDKHLKIINYNIRSFFRNIDCFLSFFATLEYSPDIIVLTETWLHEDNKEFAKLEGYEAIHTIRENGRSGGVSMYYLYKYNVQQIVPMSLSNESIESCGIKLSLELENFYILAVYRPHGSTVENLISLFDMMFGSVGPMNSKQMIILGDLNVNLLETDNNVRTLSNFLRSYFFVPIVTEATRFSPLLTINPSLLDHAWINFIKPNYNVSIILTDQTDHFPILLSFQLDMRIYMDETVEVTFRDMKPSSKVIFKEKLLSHNWETVFTVESFAQ